MDISAKPELRLVIGGQPAEPDPGCLWDGGRDLFDPPDHMWDEPVWLCPFIPGRPLVENCFSMARPLFGKPRAEWAMALAGELVERRPDADRGKQKRGWAAAVLLASAIDHGLRGEVGRWREAVHDVTELSGVRENTAMGRLKQLVREGLARPANPPGYWLDVEPVARAEDYLGLAE